MILTAIISFLLGVMFGAFITLLVVGSSKKDDYSDIDNLRDV